MAHNIDIYEKIGEPVLCFVVIINHCKTFWRLTRPEPINKTFNCFVSK